MKERSQIRDGYTDIAPGKIASVVTYLEMRTPPTGPRLKAKPGWNLRQHREPNLEWYRRLFQKVGQDWFWFSRLRMSDDELRAIIHDPNVDVFALEIDGDEKGILELDRREMPDIEVAFIGLTADCIGQGAGRFLLEEALQQAWAHHPSRVHVHTCTLDHHRALSFYIRAGFIPYKRAIEVSNDPRVDGTVPRDAAPHCPIL
jgi:GNAT superfamily N-acetyltransferase